MSGAVATDTHEETKSEFLIPPISNRVLFKATLKPNADEIKILSKDLGLSEAQISDAQSKQVKVDVGEPYYQNLISVLKKEVIPKDILSQLDDFDFHFVSLTCFFRPDPGCRINWARFEVELSATSKSGELLEKPIAWYIFPKKISSQTKYKREVSLTFGIGFTLIPIQIGPEIVVRRDKEFVVYEPAIFSSGLRSSSVSWDFRSTRSEEISGDQSDLLLIVRTAKNSKIMGRFLLSAKGECNIIKGIPIPIPFHKKEDPVYYPLSK